MADSRIGLPTEGGFAKGPATNTFATTTARDTYATNNAAWLAAYDGNPNLYVEVTSGGSTTFYRRWNGAWATFDVALKGDTGATGPPGSAAAVNRANVYSQAKSIIVGGDHITATNDDTGETVTLDGEAGGGASADKGAWVSGTSYAVGDRVTQGSGIYQCRTANSDTAFTPSHWYLLNQSVHPGQGIGVTVNGKDATVAVEAAGISTTMLQDDSVTSDKLGSGAVHEDNLNGGSVSTPKIKDGSVTAAKLASDATRRGAGLGLELDNDDLELSHEVLTAVFPVKGVWTYKTALTQANAYEINNSNDNDTLPSGVDAANVDFVQMDKETFAPFLEDYPVGWPIYIEDSDGGEQLLFWPAYKRDDPLDGSVIQFWYDPTKAVKKGLGQYRQFTTNASLKVGFADMGVPPYLRGALPTGVAASVSRAIKLLTDVFGDLTVGDIQDFVTPEAEYVSQSGWQWRGEYDSDNPPTVSQAGHIGETNPGQLWAQPTSANLADVARYMRRDHIFRVVKDASNYISYRVNQDVASVGAGTQRYFAYSKVKVGSIAKDDAVSLHLYGPFFTNDRVATSIGDDPDDIHAPTSKAVADFVEAHGTTLPGSPRLGQTFVLTAADGSNTAGLYFCRTAGTWEKA